METLDKFFKWGKFYGINYTTTELPTLPAQIMEAITKLIKDAASCVTVGTVTSTASILILCWLKALAVKSKLAIWFYVGLIGFNNLRWLKAL